MLTEKQAARLDELERIEAAGSLTNGERIRLRDLREQRDLLALRDQQRVLNDHQQREYDRLVELEMSGNLSVSGVEKLRKLRSNQQFLRDNPQFVTSTPRQAGKGHQSMIDDLVKVAAFDIARQQYRMPDGTVLTADQLANMNKTQLLHQVYLNQQALGQRAPAPAPTNPWVMPSDEYHVTKGTIVRWKSKKLFTYVAVWVPAHWYITGSGVYYGGNTFTHDDFLNRVIGDAEVSDLELVTELEPMVLGP